MRQSKRYIYARNRYIQFLRKPAIGGGLFLLPPGEGQDEGIKIKVFFLILNPLPQPNVAGLSCPASCGRAFRDPIRSRRIYTSGEGFQDFVLNSYFHYYWVLSFAGAAKGMSDSGPSHIPCFV